MRLVTAVAASSGAAHWVQSGYFLHADFVQVELGRSGQGVIEIATAGTGLADCQTARRLHGGGHSAMQPMSEKADLVWLAQILSVTKALVFGFAPEIPATNPGRSVERPLFVRAVSSSRNAPVEHHRPRSAYAYPSSLHP